LYKLKGKIQRGSSQKRIEKKHREKGVKHDFFKEKKVVKRATSQNYEGSFKGTFRKTKNAELKHLT